MMNVRNRSVVNHGSVVSSQRSRRRGESVRNVIEPAARGQMKPLVTFLARSELSLAYNRAQGGSRSRQICPCGSASDPGSPSNLAGPPRTVTGGYLPFGCDMHRSRDQLYRHLAALRGLRTAIAGGRLRWLFGEASDGFPGDGTATALALTIAITALSIQEYTFALLFTGPLLVSFDS
jgi:hypothetical protein